jgi:error-prone DNA polymerase
MGFYAPAQIVRDARDNGVTVLPVDINASHWDNTLEEQAQGTLALRLGLRQIDGFREEWATRLAACRKAGYPDLETLNHRADLPRAALEKLADADACRSIGLDRRDALWVVRRLPGSKILPLFAAADATELATEADAVLPAMALSEHVVTDYQTLRLSLKAHPVQFLRDMYRSAGIRSCDEIAAMSHGRWTTAAGVVLVRQRPGQGNVIFMTIEDETGVTNVVVWSSLFQQFRREVMGSRLIEVRGTIQRSEEGIVHLVAQQLVDRSADLRQLSEAPQPHVQFTRADEILHPQHPRTSNHPRNARIIPKSRDFH